MVRKNASDQVGGIPEEPVDEEGEGEAIDRLVLEVLDDLAREVRRTAGVSKSAFKREG